MASGVATGLELMERAGRGVVDGIFGQWPDFAGPDQLDRGPTAAVPGAASSPTGWPNRAVVLCGPGNNGGDGFVIARLLAHRRWNVAVFFFGEANKLPPDAQTNYNRWREIGEIVELGFPKATEPAMARFCDAASHIPDLMARPDKDVLPAFVVVDALFGLGLNRPLRGLDRLVLHWGYLAAFRDLNRARLVAVDICSGLNSDTGAIVTGDGMSGTGVLPADLTVTFHRRKRGHQSKLCGAVRVVDIGLEGVTA